MSEVVSLDRIKALAAAARAAGQPLEQACPWPATTPAGQAFAREYEGQEAEMARSLGAH
ncbi:hypothetical protein ACMFLR_18900 [Delftia tsuruhatensis]|uniref:hypothetical protein n=1 Tax=Delftia tsuruhatensis TaxID=180282 RepID=UPI0039BCD6AA